VGGGEGNPSRLSFPVCGLVRGKEEGAGLAKLGIERIPYLTPDNNFFHI
jgi:hypothetical protein